MTRQPLESPLAPPPGGRFYRLRGRVADALARLAAVHAERERPWALVRERLEIEDWTVSGREGAS
jgi:hypothetical protein